LFESIKGMKATIMRNYTLTARSVFNYLDVASRIGANGTTNIRGVEMVIEKEVDDKWRLVQQRVLSPEEVTHDRI